MFQQGYKIWTSKQINCWLQLDWRICQFAKGRRGSLCNGISSVYVKDFGNTKVANFSVATNSAFKSQGGDIVIETTWHHVVAWEGEHIVPLDRLKKGSLVHVRGRLRNRKYVASDGTERTVCDVVAGTLELVAD
ncbi:MAG: single-stranded DNA-binding protein [Bacteroidales bacterium]|nr:single-stranded DNA-binding protein [Bacteroidales bacterium]